jgi:hypothetical protein
MATKNYYDPPEHFEVTTKYKFRGKVLTMQAIISEKATWRTTSEYTKVPSYKCKKH